MLENYESWAEKLRKLRGKKPKITGKIQVFTAKLLCFWPVFPEFFSWKLRVLCQKVTKVTSKKVKNNGLITSFYIKVTEFLTLPTCFIAFLFINFFRLNKISNIFKQFHRKNFSEKLLVWKIKRIFSLDKNAHFLAGFSGKNRRFFPLFLGKYGQKPDIFHIFGEILQKYGLLGLS